MNQPFLQRWWALGISASLLFIAPATNAQSAASGQDFGTRLPGVSGITEPVKSIMAREAALGRRSGPGAPREIKPRRVRPPQNLAQNPSAPAVSRWPAARVQQQIASPVNSPLTPQLLGTSFLGAQFSDTVGYVPPDSMADVGVNQILVCVNGRIRTFSKSGVPDGALNTTPDSFFSSVLGTSSTSDPRVRFDRLSGRWFVTMITVDTPNFILIAVSSGPTITSGSSFSFFSLKADPTHFGDYDTLGVDAKALYIGLNIFNGNAFLNTTGFVVNKSNLLAGTLTATVFTNLVVSSGRHSSPHGPFTPHGVNNDDPTSNEGYFIGVDASSLGTLVLRRVSNPGGTPSISANINITVPTTTSPLGGVPALGSSAHLDDLDDRLFATRMHKGSLWTAHNIQVNSNGVASSSGGRDGSRWYQITNLTSTPVLAQSGTLFDSASSNPRSFWIPSCAMSGQGHMALGCSVAGNNELADIATAGRLAGDAPGSLRTPTTAVTSSSTYNINTGPGNYRWGDFSVTSVDPADDMTLWTVQEFCNTNDSWGVQVIKLLAPGPAMPMNCFPSTVTQAMANVALVIQGSAAGGAGFFEPGAGFSNHLSAAVDGGGVTINSIAVNNPTNVSVNISVDADAVAGGRTITIINPDGQSVTSGSALLTIAAAPPPPNQPPVLAFIPDQQVTAGMTLAFTNTATDPEMGILTFTLDPGAPAGAGVDPVSGVFSWMPDDSQVGTNTMVLRVTDNGVPPMDASQAFAVAVFARPSAAIGVAPDATTLTWNSVPGAIYQVQFSTNLASGAWLNLGTNVFANGGTSSILDGPPTNDATFYRIQVLP